VTDTTAHPSTAELSIWARHRRPFLWRKLFSLCGVIPIAGYTLFHLWENAKALQGRGPYIEMVHEIGKMPFLTALEICVILVPITFHAFIGTLTLLDGRYNTGKYPYSGNWMYTLQRATAVAVFGFLVYHVWELRLQKLLTGMEAAGFYDTLCRNLSSTIGGVPVIALVYVLGIGAVAFHLANGMWGFCFSWGITVSRRSQRMAAGLLGVFGLLVFALGANTAVYFATGSRMFVPSEWFTQGQAPVEQCPAGVQQQPSIKPGESTPASSPKPATSFVP
jgi:succinate dehydrogenase/fumarate reductase cytochrome b subunit (b558 family)